MVNDHINNINRHDELLDAWEDKFPTDVYHFNRDGIISSEHWNKSNTKVLFILKETNNAKQNIVDAIARALTTKSSGWWKGQVLRRVGRWAHGLTHYTDDVPSFQDAKTHGKEATWHIAYINMRKTAGSRKTNSKSFNAHVKEYAPYIRKQVELINPDIVVLGGTYKPFKKHVFPELKHICKRIHKHNNTVFINAFHPAAITKSTKLYHQVLGSFHNYKQL